MTRADRSEYLRQWRQKNRDAIKEYERRNRKRISELWRIRMQRPENKLKRRLSWIRDRTNGKGAEIYARNRERLLAKKREFRASHPGWNDEALRKYAALHPERIHASAAKRRALENAVVERVDMNRVLARANGLCVLCGEVFGNSKIHFDHIIPLSKGGTHTEANLQATHARCNLVKGAK